MTQLHQVRTVALAGFVEVAHFVGLDPYAMLRQFGLSSILGADPEARIPASRACELIEESARLSGCESFGLLMAQCRTFASLGPPSLLFQHLGSVRAIVEELTQYRRHFSDLFHIGLDDQDPALITVAVLPQFARPQTVDLTVAMTQVLLAGASRGRWRAEVVHFQHSPPADRRIFERFFPSSLQFGSSFDGFEFKQAQLDVQWPWADSTMAANARRLLATVGLSSEGEPPSARVGRAITLMLPAGRATLEGVAAAVDTNPRALQRQLAHEGTSFAELLNVGRREFALRYLANSRQSITSIAELTGYATPSGFTRWFAAEFGTSPTAWRVTTFGDGPGVRA